MLIAIQHNLFANMIKGKEIVSLGESTLRESLGYPLPLSYTNLIVCLKGSAVVNVDFKKYLLKPNDIMVLAEDSITVVQRLSSDFSAFYCFVDKEMASEVAYDLPNELFLFLHQSPLCRPQPEQAILLKMWIEQIKYIKAACTVHHSQTSHSPRWKSYFAYSPQSVNSEATIPTSKIEFSFQLAVK